MLGQRRITNICFYVTDIDRTEHFWRDVVGLDVRRMDEEEEGGWLLAATAGEVELIFFRNECRPGNSPIIVFDLPDGGIDDMIARLAEKGATIVTPVSHAPGGWSTEFADPDGHVVSLYQPEDKPRSLG
jgi:predicted enzyme related to lactoylglutathione lyase